MRGSENIAMGTGENDKKEDANKQEEARRKKLREDYERECAAYLYREMLPQEKKGRALVEGVDKIDDQSATFTMPAGLRKLHENGVFLVDKKFEFEVNNGKVTALETKEPVSFEERAEAQMRFTLGEVDGKGPVGPGPRVITIDWKNPKAITEDKINKMLDIAEKQNPPVIIKWKEGSQIDKFLKSNRTNDYSKWSLEPDRATGEMKGKEKLLDDAEAMNRRNNIWTRRNMLEQKAIAAAQAKPDKKTLEKSQLFGYEFYNRELRAEKNIPDQAGINGKENYYKDNFLANGKSDKERLQAISKELDEIDRQFDVFDAAKTHIENNFNGYNEKLRDQNLDPEEKEFINTCLTNNDAAQKNVLAAMDSKYEDLRFRQQVCQQELEGLNLAGEEAREIMEKSKSVGQDLGFTYPEAVTGQTPQATPQTEATSQTDTSETEVTTQNNNNNNQPVQTNMSQPTNTTPLPPSLDNNLMTGLKNLVNEVSTLAKTQTTVQPQNRN